MSDPAVPQPKQSQRAEVLFQTGTDAAVKHNLDYAIQMYREACRLVPGNLLYRQALRGVTRRRFGNDPSKVGKLSGARIQPVRMKARGEKSKGHWDKVLDLCEEAFQINPWDVGTARDAAEAAEHLGHKDVACWLIDSVFPQAESDQDYLRHAAHVYEQNAQWQKAIACWERVRKINPHDEHAKRQINALSASATIARSKIEETIQKSDELRALSDATRERLEELKQKQQPEKPEQRLRREIEEEPERVGSYLQLADLLRQEHRLDEAEKILALARKVLPGDELIRATYADIQMGRLRRAIAHWSKKAALDPDDLSLREKLESIQEKLAAYELNELRHRAKLHHTDAAARLQLGEALTKQGKHDDAIAELQQARSLGTPEQKVAALHLAGQAFEAKGLAKLAQRSYEDALKLADSDDQALLNTLHYRLGRVAESQGDLAAAEDHYNEVAANDYTYLDVAERLRALNDKR
jgi:tetratricopeptide (TPR) repeat protein